MGKGKLGYRSHRAMKEIRNFVTLKEAVIALLLLFPGLLIIMIMSEYVLTLHLNDCKHQRILYDEGFKIIFLQLSMTFIRNLYNGTMKNV
ncbi:MAG: hypothetical protein EZS28_041890 [Streblomastix strix]|uniref:Uncharacterized protein n=1 Tax=Streblomastix strix TaxID=222440 RepID=A0A5J4TWA6_9EUKA|nr:MAG: hypothetical protein EZS28_041890 [Streblomastix strix]